MFFIIVLSLQLCQEIGFFKFFIIYILVIIQWSQKVDQITTVKFTK